MSIWACRCASVRCCHGHRHLHVSWSITGRLETARTCPEVSNKKNETHHQIRTALFISPVGARERTHKCTSVVLHSLMPVGCKHQDGILSDIMLKVVAAGAELIILLCIKHTHAFFSHAGWNDFKQPVANDSFNSSIPLSPEHHLIIPVIMPPTPRVPPSPYNGIWPEF